MEKRIPTHIPTYHTYSLTSHPVYGRSVGRFDKVCYMVGMYVGRYVSRYVDRYVGR